ncbi:MAG: DUF4382 domain-containing protein [Cyanobacterium sp.]
MIKYFFPPHNKNIVSSAMVVSSAIAFTITGCNPSPMPQGENNPSTPSENVGFLQLMANGENSTIEGFETKDGWQLNFDHVYITVNNVVAHQTNPPFEAQSDTPLQAQQSLDLVTSPTTIDLTLGTIDNPAILITEVEAPPGHYNAISWQMYNEPEAPPSLSLQGTAQKDDQQIAFTLQLPMDITYTCGEFMGDEIKGIVNPEEVTALEMTFNFDHIFGNGEKEDSDEINLNALGFNPLATLAENGTLEIDLETLNNTLSNQDYQTLENNILGLGHVGENNCRFEPTT